MNARRSRSITPSLWTVLVWVVLLHNPATGYAQLLPIPLAERVLRTDVIVEGRVVSKANVADHPKKYLKAITVMFRRPSGYDSENKDWFWVKYGPDGQIPKNPAGKSLAGRVAKGVKGKGCIACHRTAPGGDYVFNHDRYAR